MARQLWIFMVSGGLLASFNKQTKESDEDNRSPSEASNAAIQTSGSGLSSYVLIDGSSDSGLHSPRRPALPPCTPWDDPALRKKKRSNATSRRLSSTAVDVGVGNGA
ncbi:hypothetical protein EV363DRAFT_1336555 [Boletus edulis]|nr:hypothetical protein EV363DRAFT_1336555 [Boletus edulis]